MLADYLKGNVKFVDKVDSWEEAIRVSARPLLDKNYVTPEYIDAMIENVEQNGPYIVILPEIAMPHARSEHGALKTGLTFIQLKEPVYFPQNKSVSLLMALSAEDNEGHIEMLGELGSALINENTVSSLMKATTEKEVLSIIKSAENSE